MESQVKQKKNSMGEQKYYQIVYEFVNSERSHRTPQSQRGKKEDESKRAKEGSSIHPQMI